MTSSVSFRGVFESESAPTNPIPPPPAINQGTGAGGANTNAHGLSFESQTDLIDSCEIIERHENSETIRFEGSDETYQRTEKRKFRRYLESNGQIDHNILELHGAKEPDEVYINEKKKIIFIIEKKNQRVGGSKCECIQTARNKKRNYSRRIPNYTIVYIYCLSNWFSNNCQGELHDLNEDDIPYFWGDDIEYVNNIIDFILHFPDNT